MKKLVHVSLLVLATVALISFVGCKNEVDPEPAPAKPEPAPANFVGEWKSPDGGFTCTITTDKFTTKIDGGGEFSGTYTVSGSTLTTSEITLPQKLGGQKMKFTIKLKDGESDVMELQLPEEMGGNTILVKKSTEKVDLTGTWTGKVVIDEEGNLGDATIVFAGNEATLTLAGQTVTSTAVDQDGNFFTVTWAADNALKIDKSTGLVSASGKAWLNDGSVFTKN